MGHRCAVVSADARDPRAAGGEFGWRSGWAKWPAYYLDSLPPTAETGPGSPTGVVYYDHTAFPARLQNTLFVGDWALGQIHAVKLERNGATYKAKMSTFVKGRPLNVTALDVGPDGALYFARAAAAPMAASIAFAGPGVAPPKAIRFGQGIHEALDQPQLQSDWARASVAGIKRKLGDRWQTELERVLTDRRNSAHDRLRAIDLLTYFGPHADAAAAHQLSRDGDPAMRVRAARLMGGRSDDSTDRSRLRLCWATRMPGFGAWRAKRSPIAELARPCRWLIGLLADEDRFVAFAARRALEKVPAKEWQDKCCDQATAAVFARRDRAADGASVAGGRAHDIWRGAKRCCAAT